MIALLRLNWWLSVPPQRGSKNFAKRRWVNSLRSQRLREQPTVKFTENHKNFMILSTLIKYKVFKFGKLVLLPQNNFHTKNYDRTTDINSVYVRRPDINTHDRHFKTELAQFYQLCGWASIFDIIILSGNYIPEKSWALSGDNAWTWTLWKKIISQCLRLAGALAEIVSKQLILAHYI